MQQYGDQELFPVKVQVPLILSMRIMLNVKSICVWAAHDAVAKATCAKAPENMRQAPELAFFQPPAEYTMMTMEELGTEKRKKARQARARPTRPSQSSGAQLAATRSQTIPAPATLDVREVDEASSTSGLMPVADLLCSPPSPTSPPSSSAHPSF